MAYENNTGLPSVTEIIGPYIDKTWFTPEHCQRGSEVHAACAAYLQGLYVPKSNWPLYFESFKRWADKAIDKVISVERRLIDTQFGFCGKYDLIATLKGDDTPTLIDFKTSQARQNWWQIQLSAYRFLAEKWDIQRCLSVRIKKDGSGCIVDEHAETNKAFNVFLGMLNTYKFFKGRVND